MSRNHEGEREFATIDKFDHLRVDGDGICWWCRRLPATTGEHKFKRSDLAKLMGNGDSLIWGETGGDIRVIRGKSGITRDRYGVVKFPKSLCEECNNRKSKPYDQAYEIYSDYVRSNRLRIMPGVDFRTIYGADWQNRTPDLARYYAKHFGCRMVRSRLPVPDSLRSFLNGDLDMQDGQMALITTDSVHRQYAKGLSISPDFVTTDQQLTKFTSCVLIAYIGSVGVRYQWSLGA